MNCNIFKKRLEDYVLGNVSNDLKIALENHMDQCESCRKIHEEEFKTDSAFKMVLSIDGIQFNSSRTSIIDAIDRNRYSKKTSNKILYNFKRHKNKYLSYALAAIVMMVFIPMLLKGISGGSYKSEDSRKNTAALYKSSEEKSDAASPEMSLKDTSETAKEEAIESPSNKKVASNEGNSLMEFKSSVVTNKELPDYDIVWKTSADGENSAAIDVNEQEQDDSFGLHVIYIKNTKTNEIVKHEIVNNDAQYTPRNIEWWDNEHLIFVTGYAFGTVAKGSHVNSLEVSTGIFSTLYEVKDDKNQILGIEKVKDDLILQLIIYDENHNNSHNAVGKITPLSLDAPVDMQIISEE